MIYPFRSFHDVGNSLLLYDGSEGIPSSSSSSSARSFVRFENITFWRMRDAVDDHSHMRPGSGLVQVVIFEASDRNNIGGSAYGGQRSICCTPDLAKLQGCKKGEVIRIPSASHLRWPILCMSSSVKNTCPPKMDDTEICIRKSGIYNLLFISCDPKLRGFKIVLISSVIVLGFLEMVFWYLDYANFNNTGMRPVVLTSWVVTIGAIRKTISRILVLSVSLGYGVVRSTLGGLTSKVLVAVTYFIASEMLDIAECVGTINDVSGRARLFLVLPDALLDAFLILWLFTSLSRTLEQLQANDGQIFTSCWGIHVQG